MPEIILSVLTVVCIIILILKDHWKKESEVNIYIELPDYTEQIEQLNNEILNLEIIIERDNQRAALLEKELKTATPKRTETLLNKLNTIDKQTLKHHQKINKLKEQLNELE